MSSSTALATRIDDTVATDLPVQGMTCASCVRWVERALSTVPGVTEVTVNFATRRASIRHTRGLATREALVEAVEKAGYEVPASRRCRRARPRVARTRRRAQQPSTWREKLEQNSTRRQLLVALALTVPLLVVAMSSVSVLTNSLRLRAFGENA